MTRVGVVVPSIGRSAQFENLITTLTSWDSLSHVVVVDQSQSNLVRSVCERASADSVVRFSRVNDQGHRGASRARNLGFLALQDIDIVVFIDDDMAVDEVAIRAGTGEITAGASAVVGRVESSYVRANFCSAQTRLTRRTVWTSALEALMAFDVTAFQRIGGFDENLGIGSGDRFQSGEGTDLLLRLLSASHTVVYAPEFTGVEVAHPPDEGQMRAKAAMYARGTGRVYALNYGPIRSWQAVVGPILRMARSLVRRDVPALGLQSAILMGRLAGLTAGNRRRRLLPRDPQWR